MEDYQKIYIQTYLSQLIPLTNSNSLLLAFLESRNVITESDSADVGRIKNRLDHSKKLYEILLQQRDSYDVLCEALEATNQTGALDILSKLTDGQKPIRFDVRQPVHLFTGRDEELKNLHAHMISSSSATLITQSTSVTGLGGIGKTELCRRYIQKHSDYYNGNVIWIGAEKAHQMSHSFRTLAKDYLSISLKDVDGGEKDIKTVVDEVYNFFRDKKCLFVFDNAETSSKEQLELFLPERVQKKPYILITSRDRIWDQPFNILILEELKESDAVDFVKKGLEKENNSQDEVIIALVGQLQRFPLAIQQAISFIRQQKRATSGNFGISHYVNIFENETQSLLDYEVSPFLSNKYAKTTFTTWKITTDAVLADEEYGKQAVNTLHKMSYFEPDKIPTKYVSKLESNNEDEGHSALQLLVQYSMINCQPTEGTFNIHRLVQEVSRIQMRAHAQEENVILQCRRFFKGEIFDILYFVDHLKSILDFGINYKSIITEFSWYPYQVTSSFKQVGKEKEAKEFGEKCLEIMRNLISTENVNFIEFETFLHGCVKEKITENERLHGYFEQLHKYLATEGTKEDDEWVISIKNHISVILMSAKKWSECLKFTFPLYETSKTALGINDAYTAMISYNIVNCLLETKKYNEALHFCLRSLKLSLIESQKRFTTKLDYLSYDTGQIKLLACDDSFYLIELSKTVTALVEVNGLWNFSGRAVAKHLKQRGEMQTAIKMLRNICDYEIQQGVNECITLSDIGNLTYDEGKYAEAIPIFKNAIKRHIEKFNNGKGPIILSDRKRLAASLVRTECFEEAFENYLELLDIHIELSGPYCVEILSIVTCIASAFSVMGAEKDSLALFREAAEISKKVSKSWYHKYISKSIKILKRRMNGRSNLEVRFYGV